MQTLGGTLDRDLSGSQEVLTIVVHAPKPAEPTKTAWEFVGLLAELLELVNESVELVRVFLNKVVRIAILNPRTDTYLYLVLFCLTIAILNFTYFSSELSQDHS